MTPRSWPGLLEMYWSKMAAMPWRASCGVPARGSPAGRTIVPTAVLAWAIQPPGVGPLYGHVSLLAAPRSLSPVTLPRNFQKRSETGAHPRPLDLASLKQMPNQSHLTILLRAPSLYLVGSSPLVVEGQFLIRLDPDDVETWFGQ